MLDWTYAVAVNNIIHTLPERDQDASANKSDGDDLRNPGDAWEGRPCEPEEGNREHDSADDHRRQTFLGYRFAVLDVRSLEVRGSRVDHHPRAHSDAEDEANERQRRDAKRPAAFFVEGYWEGFEQQVDDTIQVAHISRHERQNRFLDDHDPRPLEVDMHDRVQRDLILVRFGV